MATNALSQYLPYPQVDVFAAEILGVISSFKLESGIKSVIRLIFQKSGKILLLFLLQHSLRNMDSSMGFAKGVLRALFYKSVSFDMSNVTKLFIANQLRTMFGSDSQSITVKAFPVYFKIVGYIGTLEYFPAVHSRFYFELVKKADDAFSKRNKKITDTACFYIGKSGKTEFVPKNLFPSSNFIKLTNIIDTHFQISKLSEIYTPLGILLDGEPGLGKTDSLDYLAIQNKFGAVVKIEMTKNLRNSFTDVKDTILKDLSKEISTIILIDELDKYIDYNIKASYQAYLEQKNEKPDQKKRGGKREVNVHPAMGNILGSEKGRISL